MTQKVSYDTVPTPNSLPAFAGSRSPAPYFCVDVDGRIPARAHRSAHLRPHRQRKAQELAFRIVIDICRGNTAIVRFTACAGLPGVQKPTPNRRDCASTTAAKPRTTKSAWNSTFETFLSSCESGRMKKPAPQGRVRPFFQPCQVGLHLGRVLVPQVAIFSIACDDFFQFHRYAGLIDRGEGGFELITAWSVVTTLAPVNGFLPVAISNSTTPKEKMSLRTSGLPSAPAPATYNGCARNHSDLGQRILQRRVRRSAYARALGQLRQPEVQNFDLAIRSQKDICRLDVAMHNSLGMGGRERVGICTATSRTSSSGIALP